MQSFKRIGTDVLGILLIIASILFGWIPGPGGIPLFLAGLGLLSLNHQWAKQLLERARQGGLNISDKLLRENLWWQRSIDVIAFGSTVTAIWLFLSVETLTLRAMAISLIGIGIGLLLANRKRAKRFINKLKAKAK
jgi:hypothetical protein